MTGFILKPVLYQEQPLKVPITSTEYYCPECGAKNVWVENTEVPDYYNGEDYFCLDCRVYFNLPIGAQNLPDDVTFNVPDRWAENE